MGINLSQKYVLP